MSNINKNSAHNDIKQDLSNNLFVQNSKLFIIQITSLINSTVQMEQHGAI